MASCGMNAVDAIKCGIDEKIDNLIGIKPGEVVFRIIDTLAPANVIEGVTGLPKPSAIIDDVQDKIEGTVHGGVRSLPSLPDLPKLPGM